VIEKLVPTVTSPARTYIAVAAGNNRTCTVAVDQLVYCVGDANYRALGLVYPRDESQNRFVSPVLSDMRASSASASGRFFACATTTTGAGRCWGYNFDGQLGTGSVDPGQSYVGVVAASFSIRRIVIGENHAVAISSVGRVFAWGVNNAGQLGIGITSAFSAVPRLVAGQP
jgi:alpha-tubulin suppressor-like RCC1 family protein